MSKIIAPDVPKELIELANTIDYSRVGRDTLLMKCKELEMSAEKACSLFPKLLKKRTTPYSPTGEKGKHSIRKDVPQELLDVFNKFDFSGFNKANGLVRAPIIATFKSYVKHNLPVRT